MNKVKVLLTISAAVSLFSCQFKGSKPASEDSNKNVGMFVSEENKLVQNARQLTFVGSKSGEGYFSQDGKKMIFQSERHDGNPFYQMYILDLENGKTTMVSPGVGKTTCGWIHPSMKKVLYSSTHLDPESKNKAQNEYDSRKKAVKARYSWSFDETYDIFSSDLNGKNIRALTKEKGYDAEGSYSPDGNWIAFASNRAGYLEKLEGEDKKLFDQDPSYMMDIYIMKADGSQVKRLTTSKGYDGGPFFSADGKKITWRRFSANGSTAEIFTMNVDGTDQKQITQMKSMSWAPFFHPSGDYIIFGSSVLGYSNFELFIVDSHGKQPPVRVSFDNGFDGLPVFTPDGNKLSWTHRNEKGESQILIADWDDVLARSLLKLPAQVPTVTNLSPAVNIQDLKKWVYYLASDEFQGRKTGSGEEKIYTEKFAQLFKSWGLQGGAPDGSFVQPFEFTSGVSLGSKNLLQLVGSYKKTYELLKEFEPVSFSKTGEFKEAPLVFVGYGIKAPASDKEPEFNSYKGLYVKGKWVLVLADLPGDITPQRRHYLNLYSRLQHKVTVAKNEGAVGLLVAYGPLSGMKEKFGKLKFEGALSNTDLAVLRLSQQSAEAILSYAGVNLSSLQKTLDKGEGYAGLVIPSTYVKANVDLQFQKSQGLNVIAKLPAKGARSAVMIGAHGDHLGHGQAGSSLARTNEQGLPHYGADDNASGVAGVLELAHHYANLNAKSPLSMQKDLYFAIWSGEELGNLGSSYFTKNIKQHNISAYLNMDMIGRFKDRVMFQGAGSGTHWHQVAEEVSVRSAVPMIVQEDPYLPTDSLSFYMAGIPAVNFFTGSHAEYHSPRDKADLVNFEGLARVLEAVKTMTDLLSDSKTNLVSYVKVAGGQNKLEGRSFRVYLGTIPDYSQEGVKGVRISGASKDSPAEKAGLKEKDVIVEFNGTKIENLYDYVYTLQSVTPNKETIMKIQRQNELLEIIITPKLKE
ncbi:M28 family peptidase [Bdellovibrio reynosensis]|uniref:M28 family peptidase n=1 Tax=Bdellovibrio reynosensis TaxID=2835041 RepID=A0ABY4CAH6_9BACT|nr:M28 family peptidase [Bdellovibrio reynosensis]UOF01971.1 M28 family peptidase [Bdellovibrio reynosensis]